MTKQSATVRARALGTELQKLRTAAGLKLIDVADRLGWSAATLSRTENGLRRIGPEDLGSLLVLYQVPAHERARLFAFARDVEQPGWWETGEAIMPKQLVSLISFESQAIRISDVTLGLVPGLLQIPEYARAVLIASRVPDSQVEPRVAARLGRQAVLTRPGAPRFLAIIDQAVLHRVLGGAEVMARQLRHLIQAAERPNITIQVIPFSHGGHPGLNGSYFVLEFEGAPTIVHLEHWQSSLFLDDPADTAVFVAGLTTLQDIALDPARSLEMIEAAAGTYEERG
jgi:transcriptional regulator with XRE-family HTH domain